VASRLYYLAIGEQTLFLVQATLQETLNRITSVLTSTPSLEGRKYTYQKWLLVREGHLPLVAVLVTRTT